MNNRELRALTREVKEKLQKEFTQKKVKATYRDIEKLIIGRKENNYKEVHQTRLYTLHGGEYCRLLEIVENYF